MLYFSDKFETTEYVSIDAWNGIVSLYNKLIASNCFAKSFPEVCSDNGLPCGVNVQNLENAIKAEIPDIIIPIQSLKAKIQSPFGGVDEQYFKDIQYCINDKQEKKEKLSSYKEFWLILVDYLFQDDLNEYDFSSLNLRDFSKIIVLDTNAQVQKIMRSKDK
jgi:hypothetical protein